MWKSSSLLIILFLFITALHHSSSFIIIPLFLFAMIYFIATFLLLKYIWAIKIICKSSLNHFPNGSKLDNLLTSSKQRREREWIENLTVKYHSKHVHTFKFKLIKKGIFNFIKNNFKNMFMKKCSWWNHNSRKNWGHERKGKTRSWKLIFFSFQIHDQIIKTEKKILWSKSTCNYDAKIYKWGKDLQLNM